MMTSNLDNGNPGNGNPGNGGLSSGDKARARAYYRDFVPAMLGYCVVMVLVLVFGGLDGSSGWRFVWALLPVIPLIWVVVAVIRHLHRLDDYQQGLLLRGCAAGFAVAMATAVTMGLLEAAGLQTRATGWIVFGAGMVGWGIASIAAGRR